ncbi:glutathione S-transferase [Maricaulis sp.]|uniref:glutathione S-transferase n=1 Tax=Maricaulis sp. TaxID=1486257 RepID=UPI003297B61D
MDTVLNETCPWSGKPVAADSLTDYRGHTVGFCNPGCRDKFRVALQFFDGLMKTPVSGVSERVNKT